MLPLVISVNNSDYASVVFAGFTTISAVWYFLWGRKHFVGPVMHVKDVNGHIVAIDAKPINGETSTGSGASSTAAL